MNTLISRASLQTGFTLLELLIVLAIAGILTAIAVPQYSAYRQRAFDFRVLNDLRNVAIAEEAYFLESERYLSCSDQECEALPGIVRLSAGVTLSITAAEESFTGLASHPRGTGKEFRWDSSNGGLVD